MRKCFASTAIVDVDVCARQLRAARLPSYRSLELLHETGDTDPRVLLLLELDGDVSAIARPLHDLADAAVVDRTRLVAEPAGDLGVGGDRPPGQLCELRVRVFAEVAEVQ